MNARLLSTDSNCRRQRIALIVVGVADVGVLEAFGSECECDPTNGRGIGSDGTECVAIGEGQPVGSGREQRSGQLLVTGCVANPASQPPTAGRLELRVLDATKTA